MNSAHPSGLRKRLMSASRPVADAFSHLHEIQIDECATIHYSSEDSAHPIEHMFDGSAGTGSTQWRSARPNTTEAIVLEFDEPQHIAQLVYEVEECSVERTQELRVEVSHDHGRSFRQVLVQEFTFSPRGANYECESLSLELLNVTQLRLTIVPNKSGSGTASISSLRLFS
jgi:F5/8 type C domain-containing protein